MQIEFPNPRKFKVQEGDIDFIQEHWNGIPKKKLLSLLNEKRVNKYSIARLYAIAVHAGIHKPAKTEGYHGRYSFFEEHTRYRNFKSRIRRQEFSDEETKYIIDNYRNMSQRLIAETLNKNRVNKLHPNMIGRYLKSLGFSRNWFKTIDNKKSIFDEAAIG